jgi:hypothetical protein
MKITLTEALQELKTIDKRITAKRAAILPYLHRDARVKDPLEKNGGSATYISSERQAVKDLMARYVLIRTNIQNVNLASKLTVADQEMTVAEWLTWRRELAEGEKQFLNQMIQAIRLGRATMARNPGSSGKVVSDEALANPGDLLVMLDEKELLGQIETIEKILGELDGKLSLFNATVKIEL